MARVLSVDPSPTRYTGIIIADVPYFTQNPYFNAVILHMESKVLPARDLIHRMDELLVMYAPIDYLVVEDSAVSKWLMQDPWYEQVRHRVRVLSHKTTAHNKGDPELGFQSLALEFEFGRIRFPYGDPDGRVMTEDFLTELYGWPQLDYDDRLMALWFIKFVARSLLPTQHMARSLTTHGTAFDSGGSDAWDF
jgi:hypothetical protein